MIYLQLKNINIKLKKKQQKKQKHVVQKPNEHVSQNANDALMPYMFKVIGYRLFS